MSILPYRSSTLKCQTILPSRLRHARSPVPKKTHTCWPSVTGDGEAELPSPARASLLPVPTLVFQSSLPSVESPITTRSSPSDEVR